MKASNSGKNGRPSAPRKRASAPSQPSSDASSSASAALDPLSSGPRPPASVVAMRGDARATRTEQETLGRLLGAQPRKGQQAVAAFDRRQHQRGGQSARDVPSSNAMASEQRTQPTRPRARVAHSSPEVFRRHLPTTIITCCRPTAARRSRRSIARRLSSLWTIRTARSMPTDGAQSRVDDIPCFGHAAVLQRKEKQGVSMSIRLAAAPTQRLFALRLPPLCESSPPWAIGKLLIGFAMSISAALGAACACVGDRATGTGK